MECLIEEIYTYNKDVRSLTALDNNEILFMKDTFNNNDIKKIFIGREFFQTVI